LTGGESGALALSDESAAGRLSMEKRSPA
jgi:hypothetical protein